MPTHDVHPCHPYSDIDGDGRLDIFITYAAGTNHFYRNTEGGFVLQHLGALTSDTAASSSVAFADYDGDGQIDVFVANQGSPPGASFLYRLSICQEGDGGGVALPYTSICVRCTAFSRRVGETCRECQEHVQPLGSEPRSQIHPLPDPDWAPNLTRVALDPT